MKLISLNTWGGRKHKEFLNFLERFNNQVDIFCFQEVFDSTRNIFHNEIKTNIYSDIKNILVNYHSYFAPMFEGHDTVQSVDFDLHFGEATFVKKNINVSSEGNVFVYGYYGQEKEKPILAGFLDTERQNPLARSEFLDFPRNLHYVKLRNKQNVLIGNLHGYWIPESKGDTPERLAQSDKILEFFARYNCPKIICGDFNLNPDTESIKKLENAGLTNLIKQYGITNTRSKHHTRKDKFADYVFVTKDIKVNDFRVLDEHVSDHLPLFLNFD